MKKQKFFRSNKKMIVGIVVGALSFVFLNVVSTQSVYADTCTWDGSSNANWADGTNWSGCDNGGVPQNGDALLFPTGGGVDNKTNANNIAPGLQLTSITYEGDNYQTSGNAIELTGATTNVLDFSGSLNQHGIPTTITAASSRAIIYSGSDNEIADNLILNFSSGDLNFNAGAVVELEVSGVISGTVELFVVGPDSQLYLSSTNTFNKTGVAINNGAELDCGADECYGAYTAGDVVTIWGNGALYLNAAITMQDAITVLSGTDTPALIAAAVNSTLSGAISLQDDTTISVQNMINLNITELIRFDASSTLTFEGTGDLDNQSIDLTADIFETAGTGNIIADNVYLELNDASTYEGTTLITNGAVVSVQNANALGSDVGETIIEDGASLFTNTFLTIAEPLTITGAGVGSGVYRGAIVGDTTVHVFSGDITLDGDATVMNLHDGNTLSLRGVIGGDGDLTLAGYNIDNGPIEIGGHGGSPDASPSTYTGHTYVNGARLFMHKNDGVNSIPGDVTVTAGTYAASLWTQSEEQISDDATVTVDDAGVSTATLVITGGRTETVGTVNGDGVIQLGSTTDELRVGGGNVSGVFTGNLFSAANSPVMKIGTGTWDFQGVNQGSNYADFEVAEGTLLANFADSSGSLSDFGVTGGVLGGSSIIGPTNVYSGSVAPGNSPGCLYPDGVLTFASDSTLSVQLAGTTQCTEYDKIAASGAVTLGNATLDVTLSFTSSTGTVFTIVEGSSVSGIFAGLANNATINKNGRVLSINYTATTVTLTDQGAVAANSSSPLGDTGAKALTGFAAVMLGSSAFGLYLARRKNYSLFKHR